MSKYLKASIFLLVLGAIVATLGATGSISIKADSLKDYSTTLFQGAGMAVFVGAGLILLAIIFFAAAMFKSNK